MRSFDFKRTFTRNTSSRNNLQIWSCGPMDKASDPKIAGSSPAMIIEIHDVTLSSDIIL